MKRFITVIILLITFFCLPLIVGAQVATPAPKAITAIIDTIRDTVKIKPGGIVIKMPKFLQFGKNVIIKQNKKNKKESDTITSVVNRQVTPKIIDSVNRVSGKVDSLITFLSKFDTIVNTIPKLIKDTIRVVWRKDTTVIKEKEIGTNKTIFVKQKVSEPVKPLPPANENVRSEQELTARVDYMRLLLDNDSIFTSSSVDTLTKDTLKTVFQVKLRKKTDVLGFYPFAGHHGNDDLSFRLLDDVARYEGTIGEFGGIHWRVQKTNETLVELTNAGHKKVFITISGGTPAQERQFLSNQYFAQGSLRSFETEIDEKINAEKQNNVSFGGIIIDFEKLPSGCSGEFASFVSELHNYLIGENRDMKLYVVVPAYESYEEPSYDLISLASSADKLIVDFTKYNGNGGPLLPLISDSKNSLVNGIGRFSNSGIPPNKLIAGITYDGLKWSITDGKLMSAKIEHYQPFVDSNLNPVNFDKVTATEFLDLDNGPNSEISGQIWFDDERSLTVKYDYLVQQGIGGIAVIGNGVNVYDTVYDELWYALLLKSYDIDTTILRVDKFKHSMTLWQTIINIPARLTSDYHKYIPMLVKHNKVDKSYRMPPYLGPAVLVIFSIFALSILIYCILLTRIGVGWTHRKSGLIIIAAEGIVVLFVTLLYCFLNPDFVIGVNYNGTPISFGNLVFTMFLGLAIGVIVMRFFGLSFFAKENKP